MKTSVLSGFVVSAILVALIVAGIHLVWAGLDHIVVVGSR